MTVTDLSRAIAQTEGIMKRTKVYLDDLVGLIEIAERFGVQKETCWRWRNRKLLPAAPVTVSGTPLWPWPVVEEWGLQTGRLVKHDGQVIPAAQLPASDVAEVAG